MKMPLPKGSTSVLIDVWIQDCTVTTGEGLTGLVYNSSGLQCYYYRDTAGAPVEIELSALTVLGTWESGGFKEIDEVFLPGWYQLGLPDAVCADGARTAVVHLRGALNDLGQLMMAPSPNEILLTAQNEQTYSGMKRSRDFTDLPFTMRNAVTKALESSPTTLVVQRKVDGGAFGVGSLTNVQNIGGGLFTVDGEASDVNGTFITFKATAENCDPTIVTIITIP